MLRCELWPSHGWTIRYCDSLSAIRYSRVRVIRDGTGLVTDYQGRDLPQFGNNDNRVDQLASVGRQHIHEQAQEYPTYRKRLAHTVNLDHHFQRGLRQGHG